jgi:hypothetical protein
MAGARDGGAETGEHLAHRINVADVRDVEKARRSARQQSCGHEFERGVLGSFDANFSGKRTTAPDDD